MPFNLYLQILSYESKSNKTKTNESNYTLICYANVSAGYVTGHKIELVINIEWKQKQQ